MPSGPPIRILSAGGRLLLPSVSSYVQNCKYFVLTMLYFVIFINSLRTPKKM